MTQLPRSGWLKVALSVLPRKTKKPTTASQIPLFSQPVRRIVNAIAIISIRIDAANF
jgi:hypothetical protein